MVIPVSSTITGHFTKSYAAEAFALATSVTSRDWISAMSRSRASTFTPRMAPISAAFALVARDNNKAR